jgi:FkbM family methyltransferase
VVDAGANIGAFSVFAARHGAERVLAVEPEPDNAIVLGANIADTPQIHHVSAALWCESEGCVSLTQEQGGSKVSQDVGPVRVPAMTLAELFASHRITECSILKMDIEGSEYPVLSATLSEILARVHYLTMEFHATNVETFGAMVAKLTQTHAVQTLGSYERGGYIFARRY